MYFIYNQNLTTKTFNFSLPFLSASVSSAQLKQLYSNNAIIKDSLRAFYLEVLHIFIVAHSKNKQMSPWANMNDDLGKLRRLVK